MKIFSYINILLKNEALWIIAIVIALYAFAYGPIYENYQHPIPNRTYLGFNSFAFDILGELTDMQRGANGNWMETSIATTAVESVPLMVKMEYIILGHFAKMISLSPLTTYKLSQLTLSLLIIMALFFIIKSTIRNKLLEVTAFFLTLFTTGIYPQTLPDNWQSLLIFDIHVFQRIAASRPHYLIASLTSIVSLFLLTKFIDRKRTFYLFFASILGFCASTTFFPSEIIIISSLIIYLVYRFFHDRSIKLNVLLSLSVFFYSTIASIPIIYLYWNRNIFDLNQIAILEKSLALSFTIWDFIRFNGLILIPVVAAIPFIFKKHLTWYLLCLFYLISYFVLIIACLQKWLFFNPLRFLQVPIFFPEAILAVYGFLEISNFLKQFRVHRFVYIGLFMISVGAITFSGINGYKTSLYYFKVTDIYQDGQYGYPYTDDYNAFTWLSHDKPQIILASPITGTLIQALTPHSAYVTAWFNFYDIPEKETITYNQYAFFQNVLTSDAAINFLTENKIKYVYYGPNEKLAYLNEPDSTLIYPNLIEVYQNNRVTIYQNPNIK
jgi:hypothetical protein